MSLFILISFFVFCAMCTGVLLACTALSGQISRREEACNTTTNPQPQG